MPKVFKKETEINDIVVPTEGWYLVTPVETDMRPRKKKLTISFNIENDTRFRGLEIRLTIDFTNKGNGKRVLSYVLRAANVKFGGMSPMESLNELCSRDRKLYVYAYRAYAIAKPTGWERVHFEDFLKWPNKKLIKVLVPPHKSCFLAEEPYGYSN